MIQLIISAFLFISALIYYSLVIKAKKNYNWYADNIRKLGYKPFQIPFEPFGVSFIKVYREGQKQGDSLKQARQEYKDYDVVIANCLNRIMITLTHPDFIKDFYSINHINDYPKMTTITLNMKRALGSGIIFSEGETWKRKRHVINSVFNFDFLKSLTYKIQQICDKQIKQMESYHKLIQQRSNENYSQKIKYFQYQIIDLNTKIFSSVIMQCFLGGVANQKLQGQQICTFINNLIIDITQQGMKPFVLIFGPGVSSLGLTSKDRQIKRKLKIFKQWATSYIKDKVQRAKQKIRISEQSQFIPTDLIEAITKNFLSQNDQNIYTQSQILEQFCTFLIAGTDTTAHFTLMMLYFLAKNPEVETKLKNQIQEFMSKDDFSYENLKKFKYIDNIQKQTGRLYGIGSNLFPRVAARDNYINGLPIKKGTIVTVTQMGNHHSPKYFKDPLQFRPQRWENQCENVPVFAHGTFGGGARTCIGKHLSMLQNKIAIIKFYQRYSHIILPKQDIKMAFKFVYSPQYLLTKQVLKE